MPKPRYIHNTNAESETGLYSKLPASAPTCKVKSKVLHLYCAFSIWICSKAHYNDQFTPSRPKAHIGASGSRFNAVHVCWCSFYRPRKDGKLSELQWERRSHRYSTLDEAGDWTWDLGAGRLHIYMYRIYLSNRHSWISATLEGRNISISTSLEWVLHPSLFEKFTQSTLVSGSQKVYTVLFLGDDILFSLPQFTDV